MTNNILVTGASGFIGSRLIEILAEQNANVYALARDPKKMFPASKLNIIKGDITDPTSLTHVCEGINTIYHLAGFAHETGKDLAEKHHQINFIGTKNLLASAIQAQVKKFIYFSSVKAVADHEYCVNEKFDKLPDTAYGMAKRNAEAFLLATTQHTSMHISILRPALVYGPNCKGNLQHMIRAIDRGFFLPIPNVENRRSLISINDICHAAILTAEHPTANRKIYFVTDHNPYSTYHLYSAILQALGKKAPRWHLPLFAYKTLGYMGDILEKIFRVKSPINSHTITKLFGSAEYDSTQIQKEIGFKPKDTLSSLLPTIVAAYRKKLY